MMASMQHRIQQLPVLVLLPHNRCNCRCVMCDIWRIRETREMTPDDLRPHLASFRTLNVKWIVFSGGEPLMHSELASLSRLLRPEGIHLTLLTAGLSLERHAANVVDLLDDVIVSIDGPQEVHDRIRGVAGAFRRLGQGVAALRRLRPQMAIHGRCTVQRLNSRELCNTLRTSRTLGLNSVSFLAADVTSSAFNRAQRWSADRQNEVALSADDVAALEREVETLIREHQDDIDLGFLLEGPDKLRRIARHFRAHLDGGLPASPRCNAPWISAVIEADGTVRPCFFHDSIGNIHERPFLDVLNSDAALKFRRELDIASNPTCRNCVCSLYLPPAEGA